MYQWLLLSDTRCLSKISQGIVVTQMSELLSSFKILQSKLAEAQTVPDGATESQGFLECLQAASYKRGGTASTSGAPGGEIPLIPPRRHRVCDLAFHLGHDRGTRRRNVELYNFVKLGGTAIETMNLTTIGRVTRVRSRLVNFE